MWPLREVLTTYLAAVKASTAEVFRHSQLLYQTRNVWGGKEKPPVIPKVLRDEAEPNDEHT